MFGKQPSPKQQMQRKVARNVETRKLDNKMRAAEKVDAKSSKKK